MKNDIYIYKRKTTNSFTYNKQYKCLVEGADNIGRLTILVKDDNDFIFNYLKENFVLLEDDRDSKLTSLLGY